MTLQTEITGAAALEQTAESTDGTIVNSPFCREIRSKKYYFLQEMPTETHHLRDASNHCWCLRTMQVVGPDGNLVRPEDCTTGRSCYRSLFQEGVS